MGLLIQNLKFANRTLRKSPTFTWATVLLIALGVGAVTTVFTIVDHVILRPLPYPAQDRLAYMTNGPHSGPTLRGLDAVEAFDLWTATTGADVNLARDGADPLLLRSSEVTPSFFGLFGARPLHGRVLVEGDYSDISVVVLTHTAWQTVWGGDPGIVGNTIRLDGQPVTVVGVLTADFVLPETLVGRRVQLFRPMNWDNPGLENPGYHAHNVVVRLAPGVDISQGDAQLDQLATSVAEQFPDHYSEGPASWPLVALKARTVRDARSGLFMLFGAVGLLLLVACANVAHLFMARGLSRVREMSIRRALGADTPILFGQLMVESLMLGMIGGLLGLGLAQLGLTGFGRWTDVLPRGEAITLDVRVFGFAIVLAGVTALVFGLLPALKTVGKDLNEDLRDAGRGATGGRTIQWMRGGLVVGEVGGSLVLVVLAGLLLRSFLEVTSQDAGLDADDVWVLQLNPAGIEDVEQYRLRMDGILTALEELPTVRSATYGLELPFEFVGGDRCCWSTSVGSAEGDREDISTSVHVVTTGFFTTFGTELVAGSSWGPSDVMTEPSPAVLGEAMAILIFGSAAAAVGREVSFGNGGTVRVSGVAEPTLHYGLDQSHGEAIYIPMEALPFNLSRASFAIRVSNASDGLARSVRRAIWSVEPDLPVPIFVPLSSWIEESSGGRRFGSMIAGAFGAIALLLAAGGLYGTLLYAVSQQRRELGIRLALGAGRKRIQSQVVGRGLRLAVIGVVLGTLTVWFLTRLLESFLFGVSPQDPVTLAGAALVLLATAGLASWLPAHRASRTDPLEALKAD